MANFSESRHQNRGPLIAVIKIELDEKNSDRIFLHLKDNDEELAEEFIVKHCLNRMLKKHIYERIKLSREAVVSGKDGQIDYVAEEQLDDEVMEQQNDNNIDDDNDVYKTPIDHHRRRNNLEESQRKIITRDQDINHNNREMIQKYRKNAEQEQKLYQANNVQANTQRTVVLPKHQSTYTSHSINNNNKYKNLYDVSGLKLKNTKSSTTYHQVDTFSNLNFQQSADRIEPQLQQQRQSSQNKIQKYTHSKNANLRITMPNSYRQIFMSQKQQYNPQKQLKQTAVKDFIQISQKHHSDNPSFKNHHPSIQHVIAHHHSSSTINNPHLQNSFNPKILLTKSNHQSDQQKTQNYQQQTKFSSIDQQEANEYTEDNYISFNFKNAPYYQLQCEEAPTYMKVDDQSEPRSNDFINPLGELSLYSNIQSSKNNQFNSKSSSNHLFCSKPSVKHPNFDSELFDESQSFKNLTIRRGQQNIQINSELVDANEVNSQLDQQSWRPSRVKFYGKEEMKSLRQSTMSKSLSKSQLSRINKAVTNRLYNQQEIKKKYLNQLKARARNLKEEQIEQEQQLTHKPEINMLSKILAQNRNKENKALQDYLIEQGKLVQQKKQCQIDFQAKKKLEQCPFRPQISENSQKMIALQRSRSKSRIQSGQSDMKRSSSSRKIHLQKPSFHPQINKLSQEIAKSKGNFIQRQKSFLQEKNEKLFKKQQQQRLMQKVDTANGQRLFHPQLTEKSVKLAQHHNQQIRLNSGKSIHSYLYELSKIPKVQQKLNPQPYINPQSEKLILELHEKRINWLFLQLDSDEDGIISNRKISIDNIPTQILQIIAPVLYEMQDLQTQLNLQDFRNAIKNLSKGLDPCQKSILYGYRASAKV